MNHLQQLKKECNLLIEEAVSLKEQEKYLDMRIASLQEETERLKASPAPDPVEEDRTQLQEKEDAWQAGPGEAGRKEEMLARQVSLIAGGEGKEMVIVYERPNRLQKAGDMLKTVLFMVLMIFLVAAAALLLYYGAEKGVLQGYAFP